MRVTMAQINPTVGDLEGNFRLIARAVARASQDSSDLVIFPELAITGYPPQDLLERSWFVEQTQGYLQKVLSLSERHEGLGILIGTPTRSEQAGKSLYNSAVLLYRGAVLAECHKSLLPSYDVFDETRYFAPAQHNSPVDFKGQRLGINICEDAWNDPAFWPAHLPYGSDPIRGLAEAGATVLINLSASPFHTGKEKLRYRLIASHARRHKIPFVYVNQVGGNDELIFDGHSLAVNEQGEVLALGAGFKEDIQTFDLNTQGPAVTYRPEDEIASIYQALVLGLRDYVHKSGFPRAIVGLSGGIDSSLTACLAVAALGRDNILGVFMPSPYTSAESLQDAWALAQNLGIDWLTIPITGVFQAYLDALGPFLSGPPDSTEENIQARIRGNYLMAFSNKHSYLVLSTGNKSEIAMGYCTLYGDMSGGLSVLGDVPKTMVYELARFCNRRAEIIPARVLVKAPSAELRFNQTDQDTLPPYDILDQILNLYIEQGRSAAEIIAQGFAEETVGHIIATVDRNEYKRRQAAPVLKVTSKAFGTGRRMPIVHRIKHPLKGL